MNQNSKIIQQKWRSSQKEEKRLKINRENSNCAYTINNLKEF